MAISRNAMTMGTIALLVLATGSASAADPAQERGPPQTQAEPPRTAQAEPPRTAQAEPPPPPPSPAPQDTTKRVVYIPETVKAELREEIKQEVLAEAKRDGWAAPGKVPDWVSRFKLSGDIRGRFERDLFGKGNANSGEFPDFNAINTGKPFDVNGFVVANDRYLNVDQNRTRFRLRARVGVLASIVDGFSAGVRLASGDGSTPVSTNQTLGGTPGDFSKYQFWLDQAFLRYEPLRSPTAQLAIQIGRFENPFFRTELSWDEDVNLDGLAVSGTFGRDLKGFFVAGAFPVHSTAFNFPPEVPEKLASRDKWLYAAQLGAGWSSSAVSWKLGAAFYDFDKLEGRASHPCRTDVADITCDTDDFRPAFAQKGNTYMALRTPDALATGSSDFQFFGLASRFRELVATARFDVGVAPALQLGIEGEYAVNVGFKRSEIAGSALNNRGPVQGDQGVGPYKGGNQGFIARLTGGSRELKRAWEWRVRVGYRYVESDAVVDGFTDSDFGLGGTNLKGPTLDFTLMVADGVSVGARWLSADEIVGPQLAVDVLQIDVVARF